jgi:hypothetical protein
MAEAGPGQLLPASGPAARGRWLGQDRPGDDQFAVATPMTVEERK